MDRSLGGPLPRRQANPTHPHPASRFMNTPCGKSTYRALILISKGCARARGRLDTRCSPIRRSPAPCASTQPAAPRLACVRPVASVHPEPGSNSSLYNHCLYVFRQRRMSVRPGSPAQLCSLNVSCAACGEGRDPARRHEYVLRNGAGCGSPPKGAQEAPCMLSSVRRMSKSFFACQGGDICAPP